MSKAKQIVDALLGDEFEPPTDADMQRMVGAATSSYIESWAWKDRTSDERISYHWSLKFQLQNDHAVDIGVEFEIYFRGRLRIVPFCLEHGTGLKVDRPVTAKPIDMQFYKAEKDNVVRSLYAAKKQTEKELYQEFFRVTEPEKAKAYALDLVRKIFDAHVHGALNV